MIIRNLVLAGMFSLLIFASTAEPPIPTPTADASASPPSGVSAVTGPFGVPASATNDRLVAVSYTRHPAASPEELDVSHPFSESTIWLARAIYSETKRPHEQELVAWVIRNRVETAFRGQTTYEGVVLDPYQFSAFNPGAPRRAFLMSLTPEMHIPRWHQSLWIAYYVRHADPRHRPFSVETRHFFSERSMPNRLHPYWAEMHRFVPPQLDYEVKADRFRFYERIS